METFIVRRQIAIERSKQQVWHALTNPELTEKYFFGCRVYSNWLVDGTIVFKGKVLWIFPIELSGKILEIDHGTYVKYSLKNSKSTTESIVAIRLTEEHGKTIVSVTDDVGQGAGAEKRYSRSVKGWDKILTGLKRVFETELNR